MASQDWYFSRGREKLGPYPIDTLRQWVVDGLLLPQDHVWLSGWEQWYPATSVPELFDDAGQPVPPAPGAAPAPPPPPMPPLAPTPNLEDSAGMRMVLPVGRSGWAIAAGYLGLFSLLIFPAPIALIVSIVAIVDLRKHPDKHGMGRAVFGLVMGGLVTLPLAAMLIAWMLDL